VEITKEQIQAEAKACDARKVAQARRMSDRERFFAGAELFDDACSVSLAGLRAQYPTWTPEKVRAELKRLLIVADRMGR
jgi:hypothetical protein